MRITRVLAPDITNQSNDKFLVVLLAQLFRALYQYRRGQGKNPCKRKFFQPFFSQLRKLSLTAMIFFAFIFSAKLVQENISAVPLLFIQQCSLPEIRDKMAVARAH